MKSKSISSRLQNQRGQIVVEYVLLLSIAVATAVIIVSQLIHRDAEDPENSGALIRRWQQMQETVAKDVQN
jgi:uncharacterized protein (UPF0333 family)